jgi:DNA-binding transcriptional LysR family regulator
MAPISKLSNLDLNLLKVFSVLAKTRSVTEGAKVLNLSQPALSHSLSRLRSALGDPLFVKTSREMVPTPRALEIAPVVEEVLKRIEHELLDSIEFDPAKLSRSFALKSTDFIEALLMPALHAKLECEAPDVQVSVTSAEFELPRLKLEQGTCDIAIGGFFGDLPDGFYQQKLYEDEFVSAVRTKHPRIGPRTKVDIDKFCVERHALIAPSGNLSGEIDRVLATKKQSRFIAAGISSFLASGFIVEQSDLIITAPARMLKLFAGKFSLRTFPTPIKTEKISIVQTWHQRNHEDAAHKWLRNVIKEVLQA